MTLKYEYLGENETEFKNILTHWSEAEAGSNDEKTRGRKSRWTVLRHWVLFHDLGQGQFKMDRFESRHPAKHSLLQNIYIGHTQCPF